MIRGEERSKEAISGRGTKLVKALQCMGQSHTMKSCPDPAVYHSLIIKHCLD